MKICVTTLSLVRHFLDCSLIKHLPNTMTSMEVCNQSDIEVILMEKNKLISVEDKNLKIKWKDALPQIFASCSINCLVIQAGINMAFSSILIPQLSAPESDILVDVNSASTIASIVTISIAIGSFFCGPLMDKLGRQRLSIYICLPFIIAWLLLTLSQNLWMIYIARLLSGIAGGKNYADDKH